MCYSYHNNKQDYHSLYVYRDIRMLTNLDLNSSRLKMATVGGKHQLCDDTVIKNNPLRAITKYIIRSMFLQQETYATAHIVVK
jgi:hypothetical protein